MHHSALQRNSRGQRSQYRNNKRMVPRQRVADIGYHFAVLLDGTIEADGPWTKQEPTQRAQQRLYCICYIGGTDADGNPKDTMDGCQEAAIKELIYFYVWWDKHLTLHGHNEFSSKACPSFKVQTGSQPFVIIRESCIYLLQIKQQCPRLTSTLPVIG